eukprot:1160938-Pelagomonas_calceolata.AAC.22
MVSCMSGKFSMHAVNLGLHSHLISLKCFLEKKHRRSFPCTSGASKEGFIMLSKRSRSDHQPSLRAGIKHEVNCCRMAMMHGKHEGGCTHLVCTGGIDSIHNCIKKQEEAFVEPRRKSLNLMQHEAVCTEGTAVQS